MVLTSNTAFALTLYAATIVTSHNMQKSS